MTKLQTHKLKKIAQKAVIQGDHKANIILYYSILIDAARDEFTEDNRPTLAGFLKDCHKEALEKMQF